MDKGQDPWVIFKGAHDFMGYKYSPHNFPFVIFNSLFGPKIFGLKNNYLYMIKKNTD